MSETPQEILLWWMAKQPSSFNVEPPKIREAIRAVLARLKEHEDSMVRHFQEEHLAGDGPEIDRWKRHVAGVTATCAVHKAEHERLRQQAEAEVERLRSIIKGVHGALTDSATVVVPGSLDADLYAPVMQLVAERDAMVEEAVDEQTRSIQAALMDEMHDHASTLDADRGSYWAQRAEAAEAERDALRAEVEALGAIGRAWNQPTRESEWQQMKAEVERLRAEVLPGVDALHRRIRTLESRSTAAWDAWRNADARVRELEAVLRGLLYAWELAEGGRGCYSCVEKHDLRCEMSHDTRRAGEVCTCGRVELEAAAAHALAVLPSPPAPPLRDTAPREEE